MELLKQYEEVVGPQVTDHLRVLAAPLAGKKVVHVNSTKTGGGVAEILHKLIPLKRDLGIDANWIVIEGEADFYACTKSLHNALQGGTTAISPGMYAAYEETNRRFAENYRGLLEEADVVFIHDPQPAASINYFPQRKGLWIWRCHIDASQPYRPVWAYLRNHVRNYDASIFSLPEFSRRLPHNQYIIPPSIDPLSDKNRELEPAEVEKVYGQFGIDPDRPLIVQVSRYDWFKDPLGVIESYRLARRFGPLQLVLAGGGAADDPEGAAVLEEVQRAAGDDPDIHILLLPADAHLTINALQRAADIIIQKSLKEGFGLTVTEGMWKGKAVIGGDVGGIRLQVINHYTGYLVRSPEGAALRIRYLLHRRDRLQEMGERARRHVKDNFLLTRHLRDYLALIVAMGESSAERLYVERHAGA